MSWQQHASSEPKVIVFDISSRSQPKDIFFFLFLGVQCKSNKQSVHEGNKKAKFFLGKDFKEKIFSLQFYVTIGAFSLRPCILLPKHRLWPK